MAKMNTTPTSNVLDFEPSKETKKKWLSTRKAGKPITGNLRLPGLFETVSYPADKGLFCLAMVLEIIGFLIISALADWGLLIAGTVAALVVIDVFLAIGLHKKQGEICFHSNKEKTTDGNEQAGHTDRVQKLKKWWLGKVCIVFLWVFAVIKASAFYVLNPETYIYGILMFLIYAFIAYVHIYHTGYFLAEMQRLRAYNREKDEFLANQIATANASKSKNWKRITVDKYREYNLDSEPKGLQEFYVGKGSDGNGIKANAIINYDSQWHLETWGLMEDKNLDNLLSGNDTIKEYIAIQCLTAQLFMLEKDADEAVGPILSDIQSDIDRINKSKKTQNSQQ